MSIHIIIDGYNLIRQSKRLSLLDLQDIQVGRDTLIDMLAAYKKLKSHRITVVFDGTTAPSFSQYRDRRKGIAITFSHKGESADAVIKKMARKERQAALVVSSDQDIIQSAEASGAATVSAKEFENKLTMSHHIDGRQFDRDDYEGWRPTTKKKGPSRRLSKRQRKKNAKVRKL
jgi:predicted RNA-binding protein with PIN domain